MGFRWNAGRPGWKAKTTSYRSISIRRWQKDNLLKAGLSFGWEWRNESGECIASISVAIDEHSADFVTVSYSWRTNSYEDWEPVRCSIFIEQTPGTFGGFLSWFTCPSCQRRAVYIYLAPRKAVCRRCLNLTYPSQCEDIVSRAQRKVQRIEEKKSRKGLHKKTRDRLSDEWVNAMCKSDDLFYERVVRLLGDEAF